jgi:hypothetical protein
MIRVGMALTDFLAFGVWIADGPVRGGGRNSILKLPNLEAPNGSILRLRNDRLGLFGVTYHDQISKKGLKRGQRTCPA